MYVRFIFEFAIDSVVAKKKKRTAFEERTKQRGNGKKIGKYARRTERRFPSPWNKPRRYWVIRSEAGSFVFQKLRLANTLRLHLRSLAVDQMNISGTLETELITIVLLAPSCPRPQTKHTSLQKQLKFIPDD